MRHLPLKLSPSSPIYISHLDKILFNGGTVHVVDNVRCRVIIVRLGRFVISPARDVVIVPSPTLANQIFEVDRRDLLHRKMGGVLGSDEGEDDENEEDGEETTYISLPVFCNVV